MKYLHVPVLAAVVVMNAAMVSAAGTSAVAGKDLCLLYSQDCPRAKPTLPELVDKTRREIGKGQAVYTEKELQILKEKLEEFQRIEELLLYHPGN